MSARTTVVLEAMVKVTVLKTGKTYRHTMKYAKHEIKGNMKITDGKTHEYFLRDGRNWKRVDKKTYDKAVSKEAVKRLHEKLNIELRERVEREMKEVEAI